MISDVPPIKHNVILSLAHGVDSAAVKQAVPECDKSGYFQVKFISIIVCLKMFY